METLEELCAHLTHFVKESKHELIEFLYRIDSEPQQVMNYSALNKKGHYPLHLLVRSNIVELLPQGCVDAMPYLTDDAKLALETGDFSKIQGKLVKGWIGELADWLLDIIFQSQHNVAEYVFDSDGRTEYVFCPMSGIVGLNILNESGIIEIVSAEENMHWLRPPKERLSQVLTISLTKAGETIYQELEGIEEYNKRFKGWLGCWVYCFGLLESFPEPRDFPMPTNCPPELAPMFAEANAKRRKNAAKTKQEGKDRYRLLYNTFPNLLPPPEEFYASIKMHKPV